MHDFGLSWVRLQDFRREAPENDVEGAISENFGDFLANFALKCNNKQKFWCMRLKRFAESNFGKYYQKVFQKVLKLLNPYLKLL